MLFRSGDIHRFEHLLGGSISDFFPIFRKGLGEIWCCQEEALRFVTLCCLRSRPLERAGSLGPAGFDKWNVASTTINPPKRTGLIRPLPR